MTTKTTITKTPAPRTVDDWQGIVDDFTGRQERAENERVNLELSLGDAMATGDSAAVDKYQRKLSDRDDEDEAIRLGLKSAELKLAAAREAEAQQKRAGMLAELDKELDGAAVEIERFVQAADDLAEPAAAAQVRLRAAALLHNQLAPSAPGREDRRVRPSWPHAHAHALVLGACGAAVGERRSKAAAEQSRAAMLALVDRLRISDSETPDTKDDR